MTKNAYEIRWEIWKSASEYCIKRYEHLKIAFEKGYIEEYQPFPTESDIRKFAELMNTFVSSGCNES